MKEETDTLYEAFHTDERHGSNFGYLWDTPIYKTVNRGAGYRKYFITSITYLPVDLEEFKDAKNPRWRITLRIRGTHFTEKSKDEFLICFLIQDPTDENKLSIHFGARNIFTTALDYFLKIENTSIALYKIKRRKKQYQWELQEIKAKYPEYFL